MKRIIFLILATVFLCDHFLVTQKVLADENCESEYYDDCGVCDGPGGCEEEVPVDCHGEPYGEAVIDQCGECEGNNLSCVVPSPDLQFIPNVPPGFLGTPIDTSVPPLNTMGLDVRLPAMGFQTDSTFPGETVGVLGTQLTGATFKIWAEGMHFDVAPLHVESDRAQILIPIVKPGTNTLVPKSVMLLWPKNSVGYGLPVRINAPNVFWVWPGRKFVGDSDRTIRIFGKNLILPGKTPVIVIQRNTDQPIKLSYQTQNVPNLTPTENEIKAILPQNYLPGAYKAWVHNGTGGIYGWSDAGTFTVEENVYDTSFEVYVDEIQENNPSLSDQDLINEAISQVSDQGGGTVVMGARTYQLNADLNFPRSYPIRFRGQGTNLFLGTKLIAPKIMLRDAEANPERLINLYGAGSSVSDMRLERMRIIVRNQDITIHNIDISANNHPLENYENQMAGGVHTNQNINLNVTNSIFRAVNAGAYIGWASYIRFTNCDFIGRYHDGLYNEYDVLQPHSKNKYKQLTGDNLDNHGISFRATRKVIVEKSRFRSDNVLAGRILTRGIAALKNGESHHVYSKNEFTNVGAFDTARFIDRNSGETILFHGEDSGIATTVLGANWTQLAVDTPPSAFSDYSSCDLKVNPSANIATCADFQTYTPGTTELNSIKMGFLKVIVVSGRAAGQVMTIKSMTPHLAGITIFEIPRWQNVYPARGDKVIIRPVFEQNLILDNTIDAIQNPALVNVNFARTGVTIWITSHDSVIARNNIKHTLEGVHIQSGQGTWVQVANHIRGNIFSSHVKGGPYALYTKCYAEAGGARIPSEGHYYGMGNVFRANICTDAEMGVAVGAQDHDNIVYGRRDHLYGMTSNTGLVHSIIENNYIYDTGSEAHPRASIYPSYDYFSQGAGNSEHPGLAVGLTVGANWTLVRGNSVSSPAESIDIYLPGSTYRTHVHGCMFPAAAEYNSNVTFDDGSCSSDE